MLSKNIIFLFLKIKNKGLFGKKKLKNTFDN